MATKKAAKKAAKPSLGDRLLRAGRNPIADARNKRNARRNAEIDRAAGFDQERKKKKGK